MTKIYFDVCCYNRPFDDLAQDKVRLETEAILSIFNKTYNNSAFSIYSSPAVDFEISQTKDSNKKNLVQAFLGSAKTIPLAFDDKINQKARALMFYNIKYMDALHIAFCDFYDIDYMLTTDKVLLNFVSRIDLSVKVLNPIEFVMEVLQ